MIRPAPELMYFSPAFLDVLKRNTYMSDSTWAKVIAADPTGWRQMLQEEL